MSSWSTRKIIIAGFVIIFIGLSLVWWKRYEMVTNERKASQTKLETGTVTVTSKEGESLISLVRDGRYEITASDVLTPEAKKSQVVSLTHAVPYDHIDPCDFVDGKRLSKVTDFNVEIGVGGALRETMERLGGKYLVTEFFKADSDTPTLEKGFIEKVTIANRTAYAVTTQVEGCGIVTYYIPVGRETLVFKRGIITALTPLYPNYNTVKKIPGVIKPDQEEEIFLSLVASINVQ